MQVLQRRDRYLRRERSPPTFWSLSPLCVHYFRLPRVHHPPDRLLTDSKRRAQVQSVPPETRREILLRPSRRPLSTSKSFQIVLICYLDLALPPRKMLHRHLTYLRDHRHNFVSDWLLLLRLHAPWLRPEQQPVIPPQY